jgi:hypothetical protein
MKSDAQTAVAVALVDPPLAVVPHPLFGIRGTEMESRADAPLARHTVAKINPILLDFDAVFLDTGGKTVGFARDFEPGVVHARRVPLAKHDAVAVKLAPTASGRVLLAFATDLMQTYWSM